MGHEVITIGFVAAILAIAGIMYLILRPKGEVAGTETRPEKEFNIEAAPSDGSRYKLWLKYDINWIGGKREFGLTFDLDLRVNGQSGFKGQLRTGSRAVTEEDRREIKQRILAGDNSLPEGVISPNRVRCSRGRNGVVHYEKATMAILETGKRERGSMISITGKVIPSEDTTVNSLYFFLAR